MAVKDHIHKLKKHTYPKSKQSMYFCVLDCGYKIETPFALGKKVLCNQCDEPFVMNENSLKLVRPHCLNCGKKEVKLPNGKITYVNKRRSQSNVLATAAADDVQSLKERLNSIVHDSKFDDI